MPYISQLDRHRFHRWLCVTPEIRSAGELAYVLTRLIIDYAVKLGRNYVSYATVLGILDTVAHEFKRRVLDPHEQRKMGENGDVYVALFRDE